jgi:hypothetical protein
VLVDQAAAEILAPDEKARHSGQRGEPEPHAQVFFGVGGAGIAGARFGSWM